MKTRFLCGDMTVVAIIHPVLILSTILWSMEIYHVETRNTYMQQPLAYIFRTLFQHEVFVITPTLNAGSRCSRHVSHGTE
jgi:hypothetical protein